MKWLVFFAVFYSCVIFLIDKLTFTVSLAPEWILISMFLTAVFLLQAKAKAYKQKLQQFQAT